MSAIQEPLLKVQGLGTAFPTHDGLVRAVADVSFSVQPGRTTALVGESGSGKSVTSLTLMGLLPRDADARISGRADFRCRDGRQVDLLSLPPKQARALRGNEIAMIFQEPMSSLNPLLTVGLQIEENLVAHTDLDARARKARAVELLDMVGIPAARGRLGDFPHEFSGGMRQRVMIAMALACKPRLLIADEPTTALDVTIQAQILALLEELQQETGMAVLIITHDLGVVAHHADEVVVMYAGRVVESAPVKPLFAAPQHPYTQGLLNCLPAKARQAPGAADASRPRRLFAIPGQVASPLAPPPGCAFEPRCARAEARCREAMPALASLAGRQARCIHVQESL
ncbi:UNVERIFIED_ORG: ABC transporter ATP-binding protein [Shinella sp. XGS7]|nr:ABC transporter ATP-binding protein [Shinella sp. XGS7]